MHTTATPQQQSWARAVCASEGLGPLLSLRPVPGGYLHQMLRLDTASGSYALKLLNPLILRRPGALQNFEEAERLERLLEKAGLPIVPALEREGQKRRSCQGKAFYLFPWVQGAALPPSQVTKAHSQIMGGLLARLHSLERREGPAPSPSPIAWEPDLPLLREQCPTLAQPFASLLPALEELTQSAQAAAPQIPPVQCLCNGDMDCKNVLWQGLAPRIIDLECLCLDNPYPQLFSLLLEWSGPDWSPGLMAAFLRAYRADGGLLPSRWEPLYYANTNMLGWLEYNLKRALGLESSGETERSLGVSQSKSTLAWLRRYCGRREALLSFLNSL